jgi:phosphatidylglycerophosphate synthase
MHNSRFKEVFLGAVILVFTWWNVSASKWIITIAAALLVLHGFACMRCYGHGMMHEEMPSSRKRR